MALDSYCLQTSLLITDRDFTTSTKNVFASLETVLCHECTDMSPFQCQCGAGIKVITHEGNARHWKGACLALSQVTGQGIPLNVSLLSAAVTNTTDWVTYKEKTLVIHPSGSWGVQFLLRYLTLVQWWTALDGKRSTSSQRATNPIVGASPS